MPPREPYRMHRSWPAVQEKLGPRRVSAKAPRLRFARKLDPRTPNPESCCAPADQSPARSATLPLSCATLRVSWGLDPAHFATQPRSCAGPLALHRGPRNADDFSSILDG